MIEMEFFPKTDIMKNPDSDEAPSPHNHNNNKKKQTTYMSITH